MLQKFEPLLKFQNENSDLASSYTPTDFKSGRPLVFPRLKPFAKFSNCTYQYYSSMN